MSAAAYDTYVHRWTDWLVKDRAERDGVTQDIARSFLARDLKLAPGRVERVQKKRVKNVRAGLFEQVRVAYLEQLEARIASLSHEMHLARQIGLGAADDDYQRAEAALATARTLMQEIVK